MAVQDIVLGGFGSSGSISLIITSGFIAGVAIPVVVTPTVSTGGGSSSSFSKKRKRRKIPSTREILEEIRKERAMKKVSATQEKPPIPLSLKYEPDVNEDVLKRKKHAAMFLLNS